MAWLQTDPSGNFHISFRFGDRKYKRSLRTKSRRDADARLHRLEENIRLIEAGRMELPNSVDLPKFLVSDGKLNKRPESQKSLRLSALFDVYLESIPEGNLESTTLSGMAIHREHLEKHFGVRYWVRELSRADLQAYVATRAKQPGLRGRKVSATTIKKELATFRTVWRWASVEKLVEGPFPNTGLKYPKSQEKPRFQTMEEIHDQIAQGGLSDSEQLDLWDCMFLSTSQIDELLAFVESNARHAFIYPMFVMAAHTGARRSELLRSQRCDIGERFITIRETKRVRGQHSTRRVPISPVLKDVLDKWWKIHPGGPSTFCKDAVDRSPITKGVASDHFRRTLEGSQWSVVPGWHCFRHSFCSNCAMKGIDQRVIDSWVGHTTESMRRRYRHLFPNHETESLNLVFGTRASDVRSANLNRE